MIKVRTAYRVGEFPAGSQTTVNVGKVALDSEQPCPKHACILPSIVKPRQRRDRFERLSSSLIGQGIAKSAIGSGLVERLTHRLKQCL
jgi:hypothetical protein